MSFSDRLTAAWSALAGRDVAATREVVRRVEPVVEIVDAAINIPNGTLTSSDLIKLGIFGPVAQTFGPVVTDATALQVGTVYSCLTKLGGAVA